jgi:hypothetical protein
MGTSNRVPDLLKLLPVFASSILPVNLLSSLFSQFYTQ